MVIPADAAPAGPASRSGSRSPTANSSKRSSRSRGGSGGSSSSKRHTGAAEQSEDEPPAATQSAAVYIAAPRGGEGAAAAAEAGRRAATAAEEGGAGAASRREPAARVVLQRVDAASLTVASPPRSPPSPDDFAALPGTFQASIGKGLIAYVCFLRGATDATVAKMAALLFGIDALSMPETDPSLNRKTSLSQYSGDVGLLVVPQASLAGKMKNSVMQYHSLVEKSAGERLYTLLIETLQRQAKEEERRFPLRRQICVYAGTYGNLQRLTLSTPGPFTSFFEIEK